MRRPLPPPAPVSAGAALAGAAAAAAGATPAGAAYAPTQPQGQARRAYSPDAYASKGSSTDAYGYDSDAGGYSPEPEPQRPVRRLPVSDPEPLEESSGTSPWAWVAGILAILVIVIIGLIVVLLSTKSPQATVQAPNLVSESYAQAQQIGGQGRPQAHLHDQAKRHDPAR